MFRNALVKAVNNRMVLQRIVGRNINMFGNAHLLVALGTVCLTRTVMGSLQTSLNPDGTLARFMCTGITDGTATYEEIKDLPNHPQKLLIDVREPEELKQTGVIPTSINIPLGFVTEVLSAKTDPKLFKQKYGRDFPKFDQEIIFTCRSGKRAQDALEMACKLGFTNLKNYRGSWLDWAEHEGLNQ